MDDAQGFRAPMSLRSEAQYSHPDVVLPSGALALQAQAGLGLVGGDGVSRASALG